MATRGQKTVTLAGRCRPLLAAMVLAGACRAHAGTLTGSVDLGYERSRLTTADRSQATTTANKRLTLDYDDYLYRPWLATYRAGGTWSKTDMKRENADTGYTLSAYRLMGKLFPRSPFPLSLYTIRNDTNVSSAVTGDSKLTTRMVGADLLLDFRTLPTTTLFYQGQETKSTLTGAPSEQTSRTAGVNLRKQWKDLTGQLRHERSSYDERLWQSRAQADRISTSWVYRPSPAFQASVVGSLYDRHGEKAATASTTSADPLYSDRRSDSGNLSLFWNPDDRLNLSASANYFADVYPDSRRRADDMRLAATHRSTPNLSLFASAYTIRTELDAETTDSRDLRGGLNYSRSGTWRTLELRGNASAGYFTRENSPETADGNVHGSFYQLGAGAQRPWQLAAMTLRPYYDLGYGRNQQTAADAATVLSQELGVHADGRAAGGRLSGNASRRETKQKDSLEMFSRQTRAYLDYRRALGRGSAMLQTGYARTEGRVTDNRFESFTAEQDTQLTTYYGRMEYSAPLFDTGARWRVGGRLDRRRYQDGRAGDMRYLEAVLSQQFGKLYYEAGLNRKDSVFEGMRSGESLVYFRVRRDISVTR